MFVESCESEVRAFAVALIDQKFAELSEKVPQQEAKEV